MSVGDFQRLLRRTFSPVSQNSQNSLSSNLDENSSSSSSDLLLNFVKSLQEQISVISCLEFVSTHENPQDILRKILDQRKEKEQAQNSSENENSFLEFKVSECSLKQNFKLKHTVDINEVPILVDSSLVVDTEKYFREINSFTGTRNSGISVINISDRNSTPLMRCF